jgi:RNA polymerase sigma factor, sigma-70 family
VDKIPDMSDFVNGIDTFKELYTDYFQAVWGFCSTYLKDREQAMDATQETFFKLYERLDNSYTKQNAIAFIYITAKNICMDNLRRNKFKTKDVELLKNELPSDDSLLEEIATQEMIRCVHSAISQLSGRSLEIATLALEGKSNPEIADVLGISLNSVKSLKKEMYTKLRKIIGHEYIILFFAKLLLHVDK